MPHSVIGKRARRLKVQILLGQPPPARRFGAINAVAGRNVDFLEEMQNQPGRKKVVPREILESMAENYEYGPTVETVLRSERPG